MTWLVGACPLSCSPERLCAVARLATRRATVAGLAPRASSLEPRDVADQVFGLGRQRRDLDVLTPAQIACEVRSERRLARRCHRAELRGETDLADRASVSPLRKRQQPGNVGIDRLDEASPCGDRQAPPSVRWTTISPIAGHLPATIDCSEAAAHSSLSWYGISRMIERYNASAMAIRERFDDIILAPPSQPESTQDR